MNRFHRRLTGASTLTWRKNGRRDKHSSTVSSQTSVVTQCRCHSFVTKSRSFSTVSKDLSPPFVPPSRWESRGTWACNVEFSTSGFTDVRARCSSEKSYCSMRYLATDCFPEQIPFMDSQPGFQGSVHQLHLPPHKPMSILRAT